MTRGSGTGSCHRPGRPAAITRHIVLVMAALATCAVTAALLKDRTDTQAPPPATPDQAPPEDPRDDPADRTGDQTPASRSLPAPAPAPPRHALAELATPSPGPLMLVPPAHPANNRDNALVN